MDALRIDREAMDAIMAHSRAAHPEECCGAIVARDDRDVVHRFTNIQSRLHAEDPENNPRDGTRGYTPEPKELLAVLHAGEEPGARLVAFYHSHPINGSYFSEEDRARAMFGDEPAYPDVTYVVFSDARVEGEVRAFAWDDAAQDFVERELEVRHRDVAAPPAAPAAAANGADDTATIPARKTVAGTAAKAVPAAARKRAGATRRTATGEAPAKSGPAKKTAKKPAARTASGQKAAKKKAVRRTAAKKTAAKKTVAKKTAARRPAAKKIAARRTASRKTAARKPARKTAVRKTGAGRGAAKKLAARKVVAKQAAARAKTASRGRRAGAARKKK